ncbi:hypothetical protein BLA6863_06140 [Burkholderia lata]|uniref:Uncharacterized protein n=2 Tax=Burkholderia lata (strain ATCC 17760 / DSM 23089 / LMG 22485 / NCIMB 9086 / R18194 / 383) TaxID=482957 RepID=A0A6P2R752_BURL3|nr:hypothetical protein BLA6863_06140 [Burkholderia lata]
MILTIRFQGSAIGPPAARGHPGHPGHAGQPDAMWNRPNEPPPVTVRQRATDSATIAV